MDTPNFGYPLVAQEYNRRGDSWISWKKKASGYLFTAYYYVKTAHRTYELNLPLAYDLVNK